MHVCPRTSGMQTCHHHSLQCESGQLRPSHSSLREPSSTSPGERRLGVVRRRRRGLACCAQAKPGEAGSDAEKGGWRRRVSFSARLAACGAVLGPLLDGIHGTVALLQYDVAPLEAGGLHTSALVPVLLGTFYAVVGNLFTLGDAAVAQGALGEGPAALTREVHEGAASLPRVALATGVLAALLELSAQLHARGVPPGGIAAALAAGAAANAAAFDRTPQGLALAALCGVSAPLSEVLLIRLFGVWHYPLGDVPLWGVPFPSWVPLCYFFYAPALGLLARYLWQQEQARRT